jgi:hypothetical protein
MERRVVRDADVPGLAGTVRGAPAGRNHRMKLELGELMLPQS